MGHSDIQALQQAQDAPILLFPSRLAADIKAMPKKLTERQVADCMSALLDRYDCGGANTIDGNSVLHILQEAGESVAELAEEEENGEPDSYVRGNIVVMSLLANRLKQDETDPAIFRKVANWLETNLKGK